MGLYLPVLAGIGTVLACIFCRLGLYIAVAFRIV